ncbi:alpha/beta fold hydrolase [Paucibacter sp. B2R-40]|uniref:alpha/beta fold hydrolase n=1 Tax=Paucibacter sp. B2R-40 TaxID=2893554 RepID=UPI0021E466CD|nr:alpha/beta fold hydrolase [Paucibacter sp. B2R-40]MCV2353740.1 alpha/beta fold hydrolase [Paucibacter sp. B2R-40]
MRLQTSSRWRQFQAWLFEKALAAELKQAGLSRHVLELPFGRIAYLDNGELQAQQTLLLLHGAGTDKSTWLRWVKALGHQRRILAVDLPGHGDSTQDLTLSFDVPTQAQRMAAFIAALGLGSVCLVGSSMGGAIALRLTHQHPQLVKGLVLMGCLGAQTRPSWLLEEMAKDGSNAMLDIQSPADYRRMLAVAMVKPIYIPAFMLNLLLEDKKRRAKIERKVLADIEHSFDQRDVLTRIRVPCLIIWGREDCVVHVDDADLLHQSIQGSSKIVLDKVGHVPMVERPQQVAKLCRAFFLQHAL